MNNRIELRKAFLKQAITWKPTPLSMGGIGAGLGGLLGYGISGKGIGALAGALGGGVTGAGIGYGLEKGRKLESYKTREVEEAGKILNRAALQQTQTGRDIKQNLLLKRYIEQPSSLSSEEKEYLQLLAKKWG